MNKRLWITAPDARSRGDLRRLVPWAERLETLALLSNASPVVSGYVFADRNNDGKFAAGEAPVAGSKLALRTAAGTLVATATTDAKGYYAFVADSNAPTAVKSVSQTLTLPA